MYKQRQGWGTAELGWQATNVINGWRDNLKRELGIDPNDATIADMDLLAPAADLMTLTAVSGIFDHTWCATRTNVL